MRLLAVLLLSTLVAGRSLHGQGVGVGVAAGIGGSLSGVGAAARIALSPERESGLRLGVDLSYTGGSAADTGQSCGYAGCIVESVHLRHAIQLAAPLLIWTSGPAPGAMAWVGPYIGRWMSCADPFYPLDVSGNPAFDGPIPSSCASRPTFDGGITGGVGLNARIGGRAVGFAVRYAGGILPSAQLGGGESEQVQVREALFSFLVAVDLGH